MSKADFLNRLESLAEENEGEVSMGTYYNPLEGGRRRRRTKKGGEIIGGEIIGGEMIGGRRRRKTKKGGKTDAEKLIEKEERIKMLEGQAVRLRRKMKKTGGYTSDAEIYDSLRSITGGAKTRRPISASDDSPASGNTMGALQKMINFLKRDEAFQILDLDATTYGPVKNKLILRLMDDNLEDMDTRTRELYNRLFDHFYNDYATTNVTSLADTIKKQELRENKIVKEKELMDHQIKKFLKLYPGVTKEHIRMYKDLNEFIPPRV